MRIQRIDAPEREITTINVTTFLQQITVLLRLAIIGLALQLPQSIGQVFPFHLSPPETANMDSALLDQMVDEINAGTYGVVDSVIIIRNDKLVFERYFNGYHRLHRIYSYAKSITSAILGIAKDQHHILDLDRPLLRFFNEYQNFANHNESNGMNGRYHTLNPNNDIVKPNTHHTDWVKATLDLPMSDPPGNKFTYNSSVTNVLSGVIQSTTVLDG